jgi:hypothetical protein
MQRTCCSGGACEAQLSNAFCPVHLNWRIFCMCKGKKCSNSAENLGAIEQNVVAGKLPIPAVVELVCDLMVVPTAARSCEISDRTAIAELYGCTSTMKGSRE